MGRMADQFEVGTIEMTGNSTGREIIGLQPNRRIQRSWTPSPARQGTAIGIKTIEVTLQTPQIRLQGLG